MRTVPALWLAGLLFVTPFIVADESLKGDPEVTIRQDGDKTIQEYRQNGFLYAIKVTPKHGKAYFLVRADGREAYFVRADQPDMLIPAWEIFTW